METLFFLLLFIVGKGKYLKNIRNIVNILSYN